MTEPNKKSRRRFLADMLFLGGGVTAAALLAKSGYPESAPPPEVSVQPKAKPTPKQTLDPRVPDGDYVMAKGESVPPSYRSQGEVAPPSHQIEGDVELPEPQMKGAVAVPQPQFEGNRALPQSGPKPEH